MDAPDPKQPAPVRRQRLAAYALVLRGPDLLLTQLSDTTTRPGAWTLPGGGVKHGEHPRTALAREVYEEAGLRVEAGQLLDVGSSHFTGTAPNGVLEDYHAIRLFFEVDVGLDAPDPRVVETDGTTAAVAWAPLDDVTNGRWPVVQTVRDALAAHVLPGLATALARQLHDALGRPGPAPEPTAAPASWRHQRDHLGRELAAYEAAAAAGDVVGVAGALAGLLQAVTGTALLHGVPLAAVLAEVHRARMAELARSSSGAQDQVPPDIAGALAWAAAVERASR